MRWESEKKKHEKKWEKKVRKDSEESEQKRSSQSIYFGALS